MTVRLPGTRRPSGSAPSRLIAQRREVGRRWNAGETAGEIAKALKVSERTVHSILARLRLEHVALRPHGNRRPPQNGTAVVNAVLAADLRRVAPSVVTVYDAQGRPIAQIDPQTRQRRILA